MKRHRLGVVGAIGMSLGLGACPAAPPRAVPPPNEPARAVASSGRDVGSELPPAGTPPEAPFPSVQRRELPNGLALRVVERHAHPLIEIELVIRSGTADDGDEAGLGVVAGELLKAGGAGRFSPRELAERAAALGTTLEISTGRDATRIALGVTTGNLDAALELISAVAVHPQFDVGEFEKLRSREIERVRSLARGSAEWSAALVLFHELYALPRGTHPYAHYDALPADLQRLALADCTAWHTAHIVPSNASLVVVGDVTPEQILASATHWFSDWHGEPAPPPRFVLPLPAVQVRVFIADRPGSAQSQIDVGLFGPPRRSPQWPGFSVANQILGGGVGGRLFLDVRERRSLAYSVRSSVEDVAVGPVPVVLSAGTQTAKSAETVRAVLENLSALIQRPPAASEVERARTFLADSFLFQLEDIASVAQLTANLDVLHLPDDYYDRYHRAVLHENLPGVADAAVQWFDHQPTIVVAGDATLLLPQLAAFGPITVLDPERGFAVATGDVQGRTVAPPKAPRSSGQ